MPRNTAAKKTQSVRSTRQFVEADEHVKQERPRVMKSTGPARESLEARHIEVVDKPVSKDKLDALAFMEEVITVMVHESNDENDEQLVQVVNDGRSQFFQRGKEQDVKRKFVEVLARAKKTRYSQELVKDANGADTYKQVPHTVLRYSFSVMSDPNPKGRAWLKALLAEGQ